MIRFEAGVFGAYPFDSAGSLVDYAPSLGYALESQSRPIYAYVPDVTTIVHETAHQWFGDSVGLERWPQIWLNEGFATWAQWYYAERHGGRSAQAIFNRLYRVPAGDRALLEPAAGAGSAAPRTSSTPPPTCAGRWPCRRCGRRSAPSRCCTCCAAGPRNTATATPTIGQFTDLAEEVSGRDLEPLFQRWLYQRGKP